jgi:hypothetical protein
MGDIVTRRGAKGQLKRYIRYLDSDGKRKMRKAPTDLAAAKRFLAGRRDACRERPRRHHRADA